MYKVVYYMTAGTQTSKIFETFSEAMLFAALKVTTGNVHDLYKID